MITRVSIQEWLEQGYKLGFISRPYCEFHEGLPLSLDEADNENLGDECAYAVRVSRDKEERDLVEDNQPSTVKVSSLGIQDEDDE